jgi:oxygen-dependent protoporphyrinogen oxidase
VRRRLGDEVAEVLVEPILGGPFGGDIDGLGVLPTFPELAAWERDHGSLIRGARAAAQAATDAGPMFRRPAAGMISLPAALEAALGPDRVRRGTPVTALRSEGAGFVVRADDQESSANAVVLATPAAASSILLQDLSPAAAAEIASIGAVATGVVLLVYEDGTGDRLPGSAGFVVPRDRAPMRSASFVSRPWPDTSFGSRAVVRCAIGGVGAEDLLRAADEDIVDAVSRHLAAVVPLPPRPLASAVVRWPSGAPRYAVGHLDLVARTHDRLPAGIFVTGDAYRGVGLADAVRDADETAGRLLAFLRRDMEQEPMA